MGLIHMVTAGKATCIVFSDDDLSPDGLNHTGPLYISVSCSGRRVSSVLLDNDSTLNVCPLATAIALGYAPSDFGPSTQTVQAYDSTRRKVMETLEIELLIELGLFLFPSSEGEVHSRWPGHHSAVCWGYVYFFQASVSDYISD
ncbi:hypothetical protein CK203_057037 [Vitis vinifera]|uniref:Uncharacterized protein n=1 Tax=Vitis vinifera TaxID=29760 RepID=A0A438GN94_VITVI|nr:hypothetical protein CK203_057037 [Vitis vinifera]